MKIHAVNIYDDLDKIVLKPALIIEIMSINNPVEAKTIELDVAKRIRKNIEEDLYSIKTGKASLTELFNDVKGDRPNIIVENIVNDIDSKIVNEVQLFTGWQDFSKGIRDVKMAILKVFSKYKLQGDKELVEKTYGYIAEYY